jgi:uncharacterized protein YneF (UPF0154 family)
MIECVIGSLIGTLIGMTGSFFIARYQLKKDFDAELKRIEQLIEDMNTYKITIKDEVFRKG